MNPTNVSVYLGTIIGYAASAASAIAPIVGELADDLQPLGVPAQTWIIVSAALAAITTIGRMWQAASAAKPAAAPTPPNVEIDAIPVDPHEGATR